MSVAFSVLPMCTSRIGSPTKWIMAIGIFVWIEDFVAPLQGAGFVPFPNPGLKPWAVMWRPVGARSAEHFGQALASRGPERQAPEVSVLGAPIMSQCRREPRDCRVPVCMVAFCVCCAKRVDGGRLRFCAAPLPPAFREPQRPRVGSRTTGAGGVGIRSADHGAMQAGTP